MKTWSSLVVVASLLVAADAPKKGDVKEEASYVRVEIRGKLYCTGPPVTELSLIKQGITGFIVGAPGRRDALDPFMDKDPRGNNVAFEQWGMTWNLWFDDKKLQRLARQLDGKAVIAKGTLSVHQCGKCIGVPSPPQMVVKVVSLQEADVQK